jgi:hypothetical protein
VAPISGFVSGQVVSTKDGSFVLKDTFGPVAESTVAVPKTSSIIEQVSAARSDLKVGTCVFASGQKASNGTVNAERITISTAVKGKCSTGFGFGAGGGHRPSGQGASTGSAGSSPGGSTPPAARGNFSGFANFGFASGSITKIDGDTLTVHSPTGSSTLALSGSSMLSEMKTVDSSAVAANDCATVRGTSSDNGAHLTATSIQLSKPSSSGCSRGFPGHTN